MIISYRTSSVLKPIGNILHGSKGSKVIFFCCCKKQITRGLTHVVLFHMTAENNRCGPDGIYISSTLMGQNEVFGGTSSASPVPPSGLPSGRRPADSFALETMSDVLLTGFFTKPT